MTHDACIRKPNVDNSPPFKSLDVEILDFMWEMMDEFTHLGNYSTPVDPSMIISIVAESDAYIPRDNVTNLQDLWPGSRVKVIPGGHVLSVVNGRQAFRLVMSKIYQEILLLVQLHRGKYTPLLPPIIHSPPPPIIHSTPPSHDIFVQTQ